MLARRKSARKEENIENVQRLVMQDRRMPVRMISEAVGISIGTVDTIVIEDLKLHKVCAKFVSKILSEDQRQFCVECCTDILEMIEADSGFLLVTTWMANRVIKPVQHPPCSADLAPCDFFLFPHVKDSFRGIRFQSTEELKKASENYLKRLLKKDFEEVFQDWKRRMKKCVDAVGNDFEGN